MVRFVKPKDKSRWEWLVERFREGVSVRGENECWPWIKARVTDGYGTIAYGFGKIYATHRLAYILAYGEIPKGMMILHSCDNPPCCNPRHLKLGTNVDNIKDMIKKGRGSVIIDYEKAKAIRLDKRKQRIIAKEYGITQSMVSLIKSGKRWRDEFHS